MKCIGISLIAFLSLAAHGQNQTVEATPAQIAEYESKTADDCARDAIRDGMPASEAHRFCTCMTSIVWQAIPPSELQLAREHSLKDRKVEELKLLLPYIRKAAHECKTSADPSSMGR